MFATAVHEFIALNSGLALWPGARVMVVCPFASNLPLPPQVPAAEFVNVFVIVMM
jgi:hypothetical protein